LKVNDENSRIRIQDLDPLVRGMDPRIRIRIHPKIAWIRNTARRPTYYGSTVSGSTVSGSTTLLLTTGMLLFIVLNKFIGQQHNFLKMNIDVKIQHSK
jgi:hypothetical protein